MARIDVIQISPHQPDAQAGPDAKPARPRKKAWPSSGAKPISTSACSEPPGPRISAADQGLEVNRSTIALIAVICTPDFSA